MRGYIVYLFAFDVAREIATGRIETILSERALPLDIHTDRTFPRDVPLYRPLAVEPAVSDLVGGKPIRALVRVYDVGAVTVSIRLAVDGCSLADLRSRHNPRTDNDLPLDAVARRLCDEVCGSIREYLIEPSHLSAPEAYTVFCLTALDEARDVNHWLTANRREVAGLLAETAPERLSESQVAEVLRLQRSFETGDLTVIDWDAALVVDLEGYFEDVLFVLELANLQLEEYRAIDRLLDVYLDRAYDDLRRPSLRIFGMTNEVLRVLRQYRVDLTKLADEVSHITKFFGDWHLARVHSAARERFYLDQWRSSVERRLSQLDQIYGVVNSEAYEQRMFWLEVLIVVFFAIDIAALFLWK